MEAPPFIDDIRDAIEDLDPDRVCIDPTTQLRYGESSDYQFCKRIIALARFLKDRGSTVIATRTEYENSATDDDIASLSDGIIELQRGDTGRRIRVPKHRGIGQMDGSHGLEIREDGIEVYPSIIPENHQREFEMELVSSGIDELDALLGGGIERARPRSSAARRASRRRRRARSSSTRPRRPATTPSRTSSRSPPRRSRTVRSRSTCR